jgi:hypothetical protein
MHKLLRSVLKLCLKLFRRHCRNSSNFCRIACSTELLQIWHTVRYSVGYKEQKTIANVVFFCLFVCCDEQFGSITGLPFFGLFLYRPHLAKSAFHILKTYHLDELEIVCFAKEMVLYHLKIIDTVSYR